MKRILIFLTLISCSPKPEPIKFGKDTCDYCKMLISDPKFGAEIVLKTGRVYKFDDIGCMVSFIFERNIKDDEVKNFLVVDYKTGKLIDATRSFYILSDNVRSPMAYNIVAFENPDDADKFFKENGGKIMNWAEVIDYTRKHSGR